MAPTLDEAHVRDILRVLCRRHILFRELTLYHLVIAAGAKGVNSATILKVLELTQAQHRGLMASLAVRINDTPRELFQHDRPGLGFLFEVQWLRNQMLYTARPELIEAFARLPKLDALVRAATAVVTTARAQSFSLPKGIKADPPVKPNETQAPPVTTVSAFSEVLDSLYEAGLHYPSELVANFVLALQTKRFAILTGISGTGKTRIAQALAGRYARRGVRTRPVEITDPRAALMTVMPYMRKYTRFILPKDLVIQWPWLANLKGGGEHITVRFNGGQHRCSVYGDTAVAVLLTGPARIWFLATFEQIGLPFVVRLEGPEEEPTGIRIEQVTQEVVQDTRPENYDVVAVRPDWTDSRGLLGYFNPITGGYVTTPFLRLVLRAQREFERARDADKKVEPAPFFIVLDEMNLARVEHYFSDFLSALESGEAIALHDVESLESGEAEVEALAVPKRLSVPPNLYFVGTVNVDESTYMFSPKVLDRAFTIELNEVHLRSFGERPEWSDALDLKRWSGRLDPDATRKPNRDDWVAFGKLQKGALRDQLVALHDILAFEHRHFGYRVANEVARFVLLAVSQAKDAEQAGWDALDLAILQKVLVKLHGTQQELSELLDDLLRFTLEGATPDTACVLTDWKPVRETGELSRNQTDDEDEPATALFARSAKKLWRMRKRLRAQGFTAWIE